ncbi:hypothetical protein ACJIZ3_013599 [Penstemon smallii]|uniref:Arginine decarboxylase n=1 Tax=Penstemon smallii TaxID=265156 RepID=A0ABD3RKN4_9LAMI
MANTNENRNNFIVSEDIPKITQTISTNSNSNDDDDDDDVPPLIRALKATEERKAFHFHFPGHIRGKAAPTSMTELIGTNPFVHDVTELSDLDNFFCPKGPLLEAKKEAAELFGAKESWFLVGGTSCGVQASIMATCSPGETIILQRNAHVSATAGVIFSGAVPRYIFPQYNCDWDIAAGVTPLQVETAIKDCSFECRKIGAVFVTSPTYNGICTNLTEISKICHSNNTPLIVDEAHGAHFKFHPKMPKTALNQGADIVIQSTHKVLFSLSQSSMLHISNSKMVDRERLHKCLHILQTTSPSWLLLASLDATRHRLSTNPHTLFIESVKFADEAKMLINKIPGISILDPSTFPDFPAIMDPLRITVGVWGLGISGFQANRVLDNDLGIISELVSTKSLTLAFSQGTTSEHVHRLVSGFEELSTMFYARNCEKEKVNYTIDGNAIFDNLEMSLNPREAFFARKTKLKLEECIGEACGESICPYPPGIPVLVPGEVITNSVLGYLKKIISQGGFVIGAADPLLSTIVVCKKS